MNNSLKCFMSSWHLHIMLWYFININQIHSSRYRKHDVVFKSFFLAKVHKQIRNKAITMLQAEFGHFQDNTLVMSL